MRLIYTTALLVLLGTSIDAAPTAPNVVFPGDVQNQIVPLPKSGASACVDGGVYCLNSNTIGICDHGNYIARPLSLGDQRCIDTSDPLQRIG